VVGEIPSVVCQISQQPLRLLNRDKPHTGEHHGSVTLATALTLLRNWGWAVAVRAFHLFITKATDWTIGVSRLKVGGVFLWGHSHSNGELDYWLGIHS